MHLQESFGVAGSIGSWKTQVKSNQTADDAFDLGEFANKENKLLLVELKNKSFVAAEPRHEGMN